MGNELRYVCLVETRRLLLLMGVVFGLVLFVQYFELPYRSVLSWTSKSRVAIIESDYSRDSFSRSSMDRVPTAIKETDGDTRNGRDEFVVNDTLGDGFGLENGKALNDTFGDDFALESGKTMNDTTLGDDFRLENGLNNTLGDDLGLENGLNDTLGDDFRVGDGKAFLNGTLDDDGIDPEDEIPFKDSLEKDRDSTIDTAVRNDIESTDDGLQELEEASRSSDSMRHDVVGDVIQTSVGESPSSLLSDAVPPQNPEPSRNASTEMSPPNAATEKESENIVRKNETPNIRKVSATKERVTETEPAVVPISLMNNMLAQSRISYQPPKMQWSSPADHELRNARSLIENASLIQNDPQFDVSLYRNFSAFKRSYELMEETLKVYIYAEGERPIFHQPPLKGIYASEGWFMKLLKSDKKFVTKKPKKAHLFYLPFSTRMLETVLYVPDSHDRTPLIEALSSYLQTITTKYPFWNRTAGSDHFLVACHDWAPAETREIMANCIRSLCNADVKEGFKFGKDASLPETYIQTPQNPLRQLGGKPPSRRRFLAFFAGNMHGYLRPILLEQWQDKDPDMKIFGPIPKTKKRRGQTSYAQYMKSSKYCICARGYEVNSPRVVEAIFYECVPVIISDNFIPPFFETLNWESFAVFVLERDIPNLKRILQSIPTKRYVEMQRRVKKVQQHFLWHPKPVRYDIFHMILHSIWHNRVFQTTSY
ncbi:probable glycosyltransferase At3g07620 [Salvia miltiorrhiza]|uniref:probable glycosyltransferase At3g07620 n=1 Tax=Salvia miltiorrhiza TaxID=226208 RepID=UPI0025AD37DA|nr:probable glycosyltransferase At3g07620 [Salvia miltiorrhiza]XP_057799516.1 probable glycosyltransferase At3g07620 [Salvia miltiorrhiza]XP_057799517.1 probable glycosyltransferase At3g07620 [Salvia miltiorrhiza]